ncbi:hypothetical protein E2C01_053602 [Portunus trituberculatus]|uniref:Uncharacterized protein n=1 Tax=Portunus trituberculatus TaxID=210409 RepID=A0A5B7GR88_PORTR|nr:hypothetical protein [Portunus trituberculatus]
MSLVWLGAGSLGWIWAGAVLLTADLQHSHHKSASGDLLSEAGEAGAIPEGLRCCRVAPFTGLVGVSILAVADDYDDNAAVADDDKEEEEEEEKKLLLMMMSAIVISLV